MKRLRASTLGVLLTLAALAAGAGRAHAVAVTVGTGTGLAGQTVDIDINTASLTGLNVTSLQFDLSYNNAQVQAVGVNTAGSMTAAAAWQTPAWSVGNYSGTGTIHVSDAGTTALTGSGSLLKITFLLNPALLNGGGTSLTLSNFKFNEGTPAVTVTGNTLYIGVTPQISISPSSGALVRGQTLQFSVGGTPTLPVGYATSNAAVATISSSGLLTAVSPGTVTVTATDAAAHSATTSGVVQVYGAGVAVGAGSTVAGEPVSVPVTVTSVNGLHVRTGQFELAYNRNLLNLASITTPAGTLLNGWGSVTWSQKATGCLIDFLGSSDLSGSGTLFVLNFTTTQANPGGTYVSFISALFNETLPALPTSGLVNVSALPAIYANPNTLTLLAGQTQQFTVTGSPTLPVTWSVLNPAIASINPSTGLLTALSGGVTQVRVQDAVGAVGLSTWLSVYDLQVTLGSVTGPPGSTVKIPITSDRTVGALGIWSMQFQVFWSGTPLANGRALPSGLWSQWGLANEASKFNYGQGNLVCAGAGSSTLGNGGTQLAAISLDIAPSATSGTNVPLALGSLVFNEGLPRALVVNGTLHVSNSASVPPDGPGAEFGLGAVQPNPVRDAASIAFTLPSADAAGSRTRLALFDVGGRCVRVLVDEPLGPGTHEAAWDGRDDAGRAAAPGLYFVRLEWTGRTATRRLTRVD